MDKSVSMWAKDPNEIEISHRSIITNKLITGNYNSLILIWWLIKMMFLQFNSYLIPFLLN